MYGYKVKVNNAYTGFKDEYGMLTNIDILNVKYGIEFDNSFLKFAWCNPIEVEILEEEKKSK